VAEKSPSPARIKESVAALNLSAVTINFIGSFKVLNVVLRYCGEGAVMNVDGLKCKICGLVWESLPPNAQQIGNPRGSFKMYLIDRIPHDIGSTKVGKKKATTPKETKK
jgi:hypothetical protein